MHFQVGEGDSNGTGRGAFSLMLTEFNIGVTMDGIDRVFSSKKVTKEMKEMWMEICEPVCKCCESLKNRSSKVDRCAIGAALPKVDQDPEISGVMMAHCRHTGPS